MSVLDSFTGALSGNWTNQAFNASVPATSSGAAINTTGGVFAAMYWSANSWNLAQHSKIKIITSITYVAAGVRHSGSGGGTNFYAYFAHGSLQKFAGGAQFILGVTPPSGVVNGTIELDITSGGLLATTKDGVAGVSTTDLTLGAGSAGIAWFSTGAGADDFVGTGEVSSSTYVLTAVAGTYIAAFSDATLRATRKLFATPGTYSYTGTSATLRYDRYFLGALGGSYSHTGTSTLLRLGRRVVATPGTYTHTGTAASLALVRRLIAPPGSYSHTGADVTLRVGRVVTATSGSYSHTGTDARLAVGRRLLAGSGTYSLTGTAATLTRTAASTRTLIALAGSYAYTGTPALLRAARRLVAGSGTYSYTGTPAVLTVATPPPIPDGATTLAELQTIMAQRWDQVVFWTAEEARLALNEALHDWNLLTGRWRTRVTVLAGAGNPDITLPAAMTYGMRVTTRGFLEFVRVANYPLTPSSLSELDFSRPSWRLETTATGGDVPDRPMVWAPVSLRQIAIWPSADTTTTLLVDGVLTTPVLTVATDVVDLGEEIIDYIVDMALHIVAFKEAGARWRATRPYFEAFLQAAADENSLLKTHQAYRRWAGLDRRRDLQPSTGDSNQIQGLATQFSRHDKPEGQ